MAMGRPCVREAKLTRLSQLGKLSRKKARRINGGVRKVSTTLPASDWRLAVVDLAEIKHLALHDLAAGATRAFDNAPSLPFLKRRFDRRYMVA